MPMSFKYVFGPVYSWRLGFSLGIDPVSGEGKVCNFDCCYCQLGPTQSYQLERKEFASVEAIMQEINAIPKDVTIDYYTFSSCGEPTLAKNLGQMIQALADTGRGKIAVITNAALLGQPDVQKDLQSADTVLAKLDAFDQNSFTGINRPAEGLTFESLVAGIKSFRAVYSGRLALQIMFIQENASCVEKIARIAREINPDEVQLNTPLRPSGIKPLDETAMNDLKKFFDGLNVKSVFEAEKMDFQPLDPEKTAQRHGV